MKISAVPSIGWNRAVLALAACCVVPSCGLLGGSMVEPVPVEAIDAHGIPLSRAHALKPGDSAQSVIAVFGEPADRRPGVVPGEVCWRYPIRAWNDLGDSGEIVPAPLLRVEFDEAGTLHAWEFRDSATDRPLAVRETAEEASRWFRSLMRAPWPIPPQVELDGVLIRGRTRQRDLEQLLGRWRPDLHASFGGPVPVVDQRTTVSGSAWDWYVDRPSPLFIPPHYLVVTVDETGALISWHLEQTYPGGRT